MTETTEPQTPTIVDKPKRLRKQTVAIVAGAWSWSRRSDGAHS